MHSQPDAVVLSDALAHNLNPFTSAIRQANMDPFTIILHHFECDDAGIQAKFLQQFHEQLSHLNATIATENESGRICDLLLRIMRDAARKLDCVLCVNSETDECEVLYCPLPPLQEEVFGRVRIVGTLGSESGRTYQTHEFVLRAFVRMGKEGLRGDQASEHASQSRRDGFVNSRDNSSRRSVETRDRTQHNSASMFSLQGGEAMTRQTGLLREPLDLSDNATFAKFIEKTITLLRRYMESLLPPESVATSQDPRQLRSHSGSTAGSDGTQPA